VLFRDAERVLLTSATVRPKTATMLGVADSDYRLMEYPHIISQDRRLMYHIPCVRMNYRTNPTQLKTWLVKADNIIRSRGDRNGIFHTVSYKRRDMVMKHSGHGHKLMTHNARDAQSQLDAFRSPPYGKVLVSPSMTTGYDFPYDAARYQIIGKIAFPDTSDPITKARCKLDDDYSPYVAMQTLVQTTGRIVRAADDWGETFIIDDNIRWFIHQYAAFAPDWFKGSYRSVRVIPQPPEIE
jgi:Rad3-related DNA helicase